MVHNNHNFAWKEHHLGEELVVVRKGSTPAFPGQFGFVGGSMGDNAVILRGNPVGPASTDPSLIGNAYGTITPYGRQVDSLFSTVHGAGRVMGRAEAKKGKVIRDEQGTPTGQRDELTKVTEDAMNAWTNSFGVIRRGGEVDEAPQCYRRLPDVLAAHGDTVEIMHTLKPIVVVMAGKDIRDPYRD